MNTITIGNLRTMRREEIMELLPAVVTFDGEPFFLAAPATGKERQYIYIGDMHPRVQIQLRAKEDVVRRGMTKK